MIVLRLDRMLAERKVSGKELAERIGLSPVNLSRIKTGKVSAVRFSTLEAMCRALDCQPGDLLEYIPDDEVGDHLGLHEADDGRRAGTMAASSSTTRPCWSAM